MNLTVQRFLTLVCLLLVAAGAQAATQSIPAVKHTVEAFVRDQTTGLPGKVIIAVGDIDPNLSLPACRRVEPFLADKSRLWGSTTVGVKCEGMWTIYVPVRIRVMTHVVMSARPLSQGMVVGPGDVMLQDADLASSPPGILTDVGDAVGKTMNASIPSGYPIRITMLRAPLIVTQGQSVKLISSGRGFQVTSEGIALGAAADGQTVQVRTTSGHVVSGIARPGPVVEVPY